MSRKIEINKVKYHGYGRRINGECLSKVLVDCSPGDKRRNGTQNLNLEVQESLR